MSDEVLKCNPLEKHLNPRQYEQLVKFEHVINQIGAWEAQTRNNLEWNYTQTFDSGKKKTTHVFDIDEHLIGTMNRIAFYMYKGFMEEPFMKVGADLVVEESEQLRAIVENQNRKDFDALWENSV